MKGISPPNHNKSLVKSLTRSTDKETRPREVSQRRNSCSSERNLRKLGAAKNNDVENRWREISKVEPFHNF